MHYPFYHYQGDRDWHRPGLNVLVKIKPLAVWESNLYLLFRGQSRHSFRCQRSEVK